MANNSSKKGIIALVVALIILLLGYAYFSGSEPNDSAINSLDTISNVDVNSEASVKGAKILTLLSQIRSLKIDTSIFKDRSFQSLVDYTVEVPPQNVGKNNLFADFASSNNVSASANNSTRTNR